MDGNTIAAAKASMRSGMGGSRQRFEAEASSRAAMLSGMGGSRKRIMSLEDMASMVPDVETEPKSEEANDSMTMEQTAEATEGLTRSQSSEHIMMELSPEEIVLPPRLPSAVKKSRKGDDLLVVFDMDRTMVGNLATLSDRDNMETNADWSWWPEGRHRGLSPEEIQPFLERGMLRPGLIGLIKYLNEIGCTMVVYTHSEQRWASKVCAAMEKMVGFNFIRKLFHRLDCKGQDRHPEFAARKSLQYVAEQLHQEPGLSWVQVENMLLFDDDGAALGAGELARLVRVPSYDYWEACPWDEVITPELLQKQSPELIERVRCSVIQWGYAPPSYGKKEDELSEEDKKADAVWAEKVEKQHSMAASYNKLAQLDRIWMNVQTALEKVEELDEVEMEALPERLRRAAGTAARAARRR